MFCSKCTKNSGDFIMGAYETKLNDNKNITLIEEYVEFECNECNDTFYKFLVYKPVDKEVIVKCSNCGKNDKLYELWLDTPVMTENASVDTVGEKYRAVYEFKCKCSLLKRTKNKIKFEVILLEMKDVDEIPENFGTF